MFTLFHSAHLSPPPRLIPALLLFFFSNMFLISRLFQYLCLKTPIRYLFFKTPMTINTIDSIARRALLVGITYEDLQDKLSETYPNENFRLPGTHKDPLRIKKLLVGKVEAIARIRLALCSLFLILIHTLT